MSTPDLGGVRDSSGVKGSDVRKEEVGNLGSRVITKKRRVGDRISSLFRNSTAGNSSSSEDEVGGIYSKEEVREARSQIRKGIEIDQYDQMDTKLGTIKSGMEIFSSDKNKKFFESHKKEFSETVLMKHFNKEEMSSVITEDRLLDDLDRSALEISGIGDVKTVFPGQRATLETTGKKSEKEVISDRKLASDMLTKLLADKNKDISKEALFKVLHFASNQNTLFPVLAINLSIMPQNAKEQKELFINKDGISHIVRTLVADSVQDLSVQDVKKKNVGGKFFARMEATFDKVGNMTEAKLTLLSQNLDLSQKEFPKEG